MNSYPSIDEVIEFILDSRDPNEREEGFVDWMQELFKIDPSILEVAKEVYLRGA